MADVLSQGDTGGVEVEPTIAEGAGVSHTPLNATLEGPKSLRSR